MLDNKLIYQWDNSGDFYAQEECTVARLAINLKFDQVTFNSLVFTLERRFEVTFGIFSALVSQINVLESYLDIYLF